MRRSTLRLALALPLTALLLLAASQEDEPLRLGAGEHVYTWDGTWFDAGEKGIGRTHGAIAIDAAGRVLASSDGRGGVLVFDQAGELTSAWGSDLKGGVHGMTLVRDGDTELLLLAHHRLGEVIATTLDGEIRWRLGAPDVAGMYDEESRFRPTSTAVAPNGDLYVADGYGQSWIHHYDRDRSYLGSFGGHGTAPGQLRTPHGLAVDTRRDPAVLLVADRENGRLQAFSLAGEFLAVLPAEVRRPCSIVIRDDHVVVADLHGRVTILGPDDRVLCHLGDNPDESQWARFDNPSEAWREGVFFAPHHATWDAAGNLYVMDWSKTGRVTRLERVR